eukprot:scaffold234124_cov35-Tisochrysis_lutea.AAC.1
MKGVTKNYRVYSWSGMETKAFGGFYYEIKKKVVGQGTNLLSAWHSFWPALIESPLITTSLLPREIMWRDYASRSKTGEVTSVAAYIPSVAWLLVAWSRESPRRHQCSRTVKAS